MTSHHIDPIRSKYTPETLSRPSFLGHEFSCHHYVHAHFLHLPDSSHDRIGRVTPRTPCVALPRVVLIKCNWYIVLVMDMPWVPVRVVVHTTWHMCGRARACLEACGDDHFTHCYTSSDTIRYTLSLHVCPRHGATESDTCANG